ncbi:Vacuolar protein sorting-associated protein 13B [Liparis tanakae]|uniref:Vacuolar protein sorting-associated protein 13B n=1 Tax=Liparis tanakae TaxID=230148 RepID=A0A4Z2ED74_9TELE|nr:Vacuolar protein sorting-associated protein 13B [Liparis tanakae]
MEVVLVLMMGEPFFDCQIGFVGCRALCLKGIMGVRDFEENMNRLEEDAVFFSCGDSLRSKGMTYLTNSLFDYRSPENNGVRAEFILDSTNHKVRKENETLVFTKRYCQDNLWNRDLSSAPTCGGSFNSIQLIFYVTNLPLRALGHFIHSAICY